MKSSTSTAARRLKLTAPIDRWDEAIPLGNGLMGTLLWGQGNRILLSLDRGDLWDLRPVESFSHPDWTWATLRKLVAQGDGARIKKLFEDPYETQPYPTKIPAGRIELTLDRKIAVTEFALDMTTAMGSAKWSGGTSKGKPGAGTGGGMQLFCSAAARVALAFVRGSGVKIKVAPAPFSGTVKNNQTNSLAGGDLATLGYPAPKLGKSGALRWSLQQGADGFAFAIVVGERPVPGGTLIAYTVASTKDGPDPVAVGQETVRQALAAGFETMLKPHIRWWRSFWNQSNVQVPDPQVQQHYNLVRYFYGSASRRGAPPMAIQGVWTADEGKLPPWKGDYHHDLNSQMCYWAYLTPNHLEEGLSFLDYLWDLLPLGQRFARDFYGTSGACLPGVAALDGQPLGGWAQYTVVPSSSAWLAHAFYLHWRHTMDRAFLADRAYPWCAQIGQCIEALLERAPDGTLKLPLSASPEYHDNQMAAWMTPNSNYDLSLMRWLFGALAEMAGELGDATAADHWRSILSQMENLHVGAGLWGMKVLMLSPTEMLGESHRHHAHLMPIHPLGTLTIEGSDEDRAVISGSLNQLDQLGTGLWVGFSFSWVGCLAARAGQAEKARTMLEMFIRGFISRNGFDLNGDYKNQGWSLYKYRPFTLEANFAAAQAVHEMLLQTWGSVVRIFPAVSELWRDVSFENWRGEGAYRISAKRAEGRTHWIRITSERGGLLRLRDPFAGVKPIWSRRGVKKVGTDYVIQLAAGQTLEGKAGCGALKLVNGMMRRPR